MIGAGGGGEAAIDLSSADASGFAALTARFPAALPLGASIRPLEFAAVFAAVFIGIAPEAEFAATTFAVSETAAALFALG